MIPSAAREPNGGGITGEVELVPAPFIAHVFRSAQRTLRLLACSRPAFKDGGPRPTLLAIMLIGAVWGCVSTATATYHHRDKSGETTITVQSPDHPVHPPSISFSDKGGMTISGGASQGIDQALAGVSHTTGWLAVVLILGGVAALIARFWLPFVPMLAPIILIAAGGGLIMMPVLVDRYAPEIGIGIAGVIVVGGYELWTHRRDLLKEPPLVKTKSTPPTAPLVAAMNAGNSNTPPTQGA